MLESIKEIFQSPEMITLISTIGGILVANAGTIFVFALKYLGLKRAEIKSKVEHNKVVEELEAKYQKKVESLEKKIDEKLESIESVVVKKVKEQKEARDSEIKAETISIEEAIKETKKLLELDE